ncbi:MAG: symmetrical bis(5'-nucleosyl)-tetraphosphatase [Magnetococcales bacterium]|nr:symmetrical bis(5'-nucleosyl)-tetraphosphatase [Magnetococcales bacterium]
MAVYAIGDLHGCLPELKSLLAKIGFNRHQDRLWFVGDLLSRGPDSLGVLRFVRDLGDRAVVVMGNHEVRALVGLSGKDSQEFNDYMGFFAKAADCDELYDWIRYLPLVHRDETLGYTMVHAGLHPNWSLDDALMRSDRLTEIFRDKKRIRKFFKKNQARSVVEEPDFKSDENGWLQYALTVMTKVRYCTRSGGLLSARLIREQGILTSGYGEPAKDSPYQPWYTHRTGRGDEKIIYGHWAMAGLTLNRFTFGLDSGAVYGGKLTAMRLDHPNRPITQVRSKPYISIQDLTPTR